MVTTIAATAEKLNKYKAKTMTGKKVIGYQHHKKDTLIEDKSDSQFTLGSPGDLAAKEERTEEEK